MIRNLFRTAGIGTRSSLAALAASVCLLMAAGNLAAQSTSWELEWQSGAEWTPRRNQTGVAFNNRLWVMGGNDGGIRNDVWSSADGITWTQETAAAQWSARTDHAVVVFNNRLWVLGGAAGSNRQSDVWSSTDGITWTQEAATAWPTRSAHAAVVFNNKLWVLGGEGPTGTTARLNDVWSSDDGINWTQEPATGHWAVRGGHAAVVYNNQIWVMGGNESSSSSRLNDVWSSADGINWTQQNATGHWSARRGHAALVFNNQLWVLAGNAGSNQRDVWSTTDGVNWTQVAAPAPWPTRQNFAAAVHNNRLWVMGGNGPGPGTAHRQNDVWSSADGSNWTQETDPPQWSAREGHATTVFNNRLWILGGNDGNNLNDVWSSADGATWRLETAAAGWVTRQFHAAVAFDDGVRGERLWVLGGNGPGSTTAASNRQNDVWSSADGITWTIETTPGWAARYGHAVAVFNNKLWVIGGRTSGNQKDIWSTTDGVNWVQEVASAPWPQRSHHTVVVHDNRLWIMGGNGTSTSSTARLGDVWSSTDGVNWTQEPTPSWSARYAHASAVFGNKLWVLAGNATGNPNDAWSSPDGINWTQDTVEWSARTAHTAAVFNNKLWLLGGSGGTPPSPKDDVWSRPDDSPRITSTPATHIEVNAAYSYTITATGNPVPNISVSNLPSWLSFNSTTNTIFGTAPAAPAATGNILVEATNSLGIDDQQFSIVVGTLPSFTTTPGTTALQGQLYTYSITMTGVPSPTLGVAGLPNWLTLTGNTLQGTPGAGDLGLTGVITLTATNNIGSTPQAFQIDVEGPPLITSGAPTNAEVSVAYSFTFVANGNPAPTFGISGNPAWLNINPATGEIFGTPAAGDEGQTSTITVTATNTNGSDDYPFSIDVHRAPEITSSAPTTATAGQQYSYTIVAVGYPAPTFQLAGNPAWLQLNTAGDGIEGTPGAAHIGGPVTVTVTASNGIGSDHDEQFQLTVIGIAPSFTSTEVDTATAGTLYTYTATADGAPAPALSAPTLPAWLTFDPNTGELTGTPAVGDIGTAGNDVVLEATNVQGTDTQSFTINVSGTAPTFTSTPSQFATVGVLYSETITAAGLPDPTLTEVQLPAWLTFNPTTGVLSGTPGTANIGTSGTDVEIDADNGWGTDTLAFAIQVNGVVPIITSTAPATATVGQLYTYNLTATGDPAPTFAISASTPLPAWLGFAGNLLSGTPDAADVGSVVSVTVIATNVQGQDDQSFSITVQGIPPQITSTAALQGNVGQAYSYTVTATGTPAPTLSAGALPAWLQFDPLTGVLSGTPTTADEGPSPSITITAANGWGSNATQTFTITVGPSIGSGGGGGKSGGGCTVGALPTVPGVFVTLLLVALATMRRRKAA
jgi:hypothetical protein